MAKNQTVNDLRVKMQEVLESLVTNPAKDYPSYLERIGMYNGLEEAIQIVVRAENEDDIKPTF
jgi:hypothetical protein